MICHCSKDKTDLSGWPDLLQLPPVVMTIMHSIGIFLSGHIYLNLFLCEHDIGANCGHAHSDDQAAIAAVRACTD